MVTNYVYVNCFILIQPVKSGMQYIYTLRKIFEWMKVWIERCKQTNNGRLSWYGESTLVKKAQHSGDTNLTQREIDLAYVLKYY